MNKLIPAAIAAVAIAGGAYYLAVSSEDTGTHSPGEGQAMVAITVPDTLSDRAAMGRRAYDTVCATCHGDSATGRMGLGPPLVHKIYEPSHHGDMSFQLAVQQGVRAHHWDFGNMPPQDGLTRADVANIVTYVRELQRANGIY